MSQNLCRPVEANNSAIESHLAVEAKEKLSEYIESKSPPVEVEENFAIVNSKYGSLVEGNHSFPNSCLETNSESISPVKSIHSTLQSNSFSTFESKENFSSTTLNFHLFNNVEYTPYSKMAAILVFLLFACKLALVASFKGKYYFVFEV